MRGAGRFRKPTTDRLALIREVIMADGTGDGTGTGVALVVLGMGKPTPTRSKSSSQSRQLPVTERSGQ
jgi:hypothetical protein